MLETLEMRKKQHEIKIKKYKSTTIHFCGQSQLSIFFIS
ncbi:hypothetical protein bthur0003_56120 [Bacillus thuringiensis serovar thuringiensis str. T01001]|uniref:Uncharacterized protein n=2 Tax=Bacillus thuringiensis TaxID=1428 RepID=A0AAN4HCH4_BACTU|nr:hypothetical protein pBMB0558_00500 [Bacillus thuringiensis serovar chinensis CT-43]AGG04739.1 hypothetical protein H175_107p015 [Bacillus thuringiensis serovar thuringiensis str. IS5056]EEM31894.1 hypothetical protein bthur0003_56120 [Bacillus thuringiensis serovar thuringiensis str. T01001]EEM62725.1 hypothetical protein bthur0008_56660 [Bacillus thuringiensis serovar berliner ATCC 10792]ERH96983.1 hypothetical protein BTCBT_006870 [Bacillus thuringiensis T01-328]